MDYNIDFDSSEESTELGKRVKAFYYSEEEIGNPEDVNTLVALFPRVSIRTGYIFNYHINDDAERSIASWITPFSRQTDAPHRKNL